MWFGISNVLARGCTARLHVFALDSVMKLLHNLFFPFQQGYLLFNLVLYPFVSLGYQDAVLLLPKSLQSPLHLV